MSLDAYLARYRRYHAQLLARGQPTGYADTVATTWRINVERIAEVAPAAVQLLQLCAFLGPEAIPLSLLAAAPHVLAAALATAAIDDLAFDEAVSALRRYSMISRAGDSPRVHRLVQAVVRGDLDPDEQRWWAGAALRLVDAGFPRDAQEVSAWPVCAELLPHALAASETAERLEAEPERIGELLTWVGIYLDERAQFTDARSAYERALHADRAVLGPDHPIVAIRINNLGYVLRQLGDLAGARAHYERALRIDEAAYGPDHHTVAIRVNNLGWVLEELGDPAGARACWERALASYTTALGADHPRTRNVARALEELDADLS